MVVGLTLGSSRVQVSLGKIHYSLFPTKQAAGRLEWAAATVYAWVNVMHTECKGL